MLGGTGDNVVYKQRMINAGEDGSVLEEDI